MTLSQLNQTLELYVKDTRAWLFDEDNGWIPVSVLHQEKTDKNVKIVFKDDEVDGKEHCYEESFAQLEKNQGKPLPPLRNPPKLEMTDDLTNLSYLNEPSVLNTIKMRYQERTIYTYSGIVLIATNPFARVPLYEPEIIQQYSGRRRGELDPHLFAIAEDAYRCMVRENENQTIVVSGESGAGKTVSAKYIMRYFATADDKDAAGKSSKGGDNSMTEVEEQILATNPIMEAFGNAKTTRNDNSSRFGKYIEIQFDKKCNIVGAKIKTYLLERSRLIFQPETERNYHIFYQLCAGATAGERKELGLTAWDGFHYLRQGETGVIQGVNDKEEFELTQHSLKLVGISAQVQSSIFRLLAALLHIGNVEITGRNDATISDQEPSLATATKLLGINTGEFRKWLVRKQIVTRSEKIVSNLNPTQAQTVRDSVAKYIYASLFDWLVNVVNETLSCQDPTNVATFIGVLDIYGFEHFKKNSFEQFCINYANEKLQQQFNQHVFKLEQEEYAREEINWKFIDFSDNQKCIEMIEAKLGVLSLLDEESRLPSGTDEGFCNKLYQNFTKPAYQNYFKKPRFSNNAFTVAHYAHDVQYEAEGFLEKNKDTVPDELLALLQDAKSEFLVDIMQASNSVSPPPTPTEAKPRPGPAKMNAAAKKPTLGSIFKLSLISLMDTITQTNVHYIRCIKPNEAKEAWIFEPNMVLSQLRACGVLETIRISCAGYPTRWTFDEFASRYYALVNSKYWSPPNKLGSRELCSVILDAYIKDQDKYQIGLTKLFFRAGQLAYLEKLRTDRWNECVILLQKNTRRFIARTKYLHIQAMILNLQQIARQRAAVRKMQIRRQERAAIVIQTCWRRYKARKQYLQRRVFVVAIQATVRAFMARQIFATLRESNAATQIQRFVRGWFSRRRVHAQRNHIIRIQTCVRRRNAKKHLLVLRVEARSVSHFKEVSYKLENKVVELTQNLAQQKEEKERLRGKASQLESQVHTWIGKFDRLDRKAKDLKAVVGQSDESEATDPTRAQQVRDSLQGEYVHSLNKIKNQDKEIARLTEELQNQKEEIVKLREASQTAVKMVEDPDVSVLKQQISDLKAQLSHTLKRGQRNPSTRRPTTGGRSRLSSLLLNGGRRPSGVLRRDSRTGLDEHSVDALEVADTGIGKTVRIVYQGKAAILRSLMESTRVPDPDPQHPPSPAELFYPAHAILACGLAMRRAGQVTESHEWLLAAMDEMENHCKLVCENAEEKEDIKKVIVQYTYWLSNVHTLLILILAAEKKEGAKLTVDWKDVKDLLEDLESILYHQWIGSVKDRLKVIAPPALIESQTLPGFMVASSETLYSMNDLEEVFKTVDRSCKAFGLDEIVMKQMVEAMLKHINVYAFNDLVMRRNFNSWKRAMQIQHNLNQLENWCKAHDMPEVMIELMYVEQAAKLLQLRKSTLEDVAIIKDVCWKLKPTQVQKLLQNYSHADYEDPISHEILQAVGRRVGNSADGLQLQQIDRESCYYEVPEIPATRMAVDLSTSLPSHVELPYQEHVLDLLRQ